MVPALLVLWVMNLFDAVATAYGVSKGYAYEVNPAAAWVMSHGVWLFVAAKVLSVSLALSALLALWERSESHRVVLWVVRVLASLYVLLGAWHVVVYIYGRTL